MAYDLDHGWPGGSVGRAALGGLGTGGGERSLTTDHRPLTTGTCEGIRSDGKAYVLLDGASAVLSIQVAAELPAALLVGRRVVVLGDDPATWLVAGVFGASMLNVPSGLVQLNSAGIIAGQTWQAPTFENSWVNFGDGFNAAGYWRDVLGVVHLRGMVKAGVIGSAIWTLPVGYRPLGRELFGVMSVGSPARLDVVTDGTVVPVSGQNVWVSLDGVTFRAV